jgi:cytoskeletal protein RodZ
MLSLQYNGEVLSKKRDELKLKVDDIATELCLSVQQVHAIENNLNGFYQSNKLKQAVIKRYCLFLNIDINTVISEYEEDKSDANVKELKKDHLNTKIKIYIFIFATAFLITYAWKMFT